MPMSELELDTVKDAAALARFIVQEIKPRIDMFNIDYDSTGGVKDTLTQAKLDEEPSMSGITKQQVDDGMYVITNGLKTAIDNAYSQLEKLASRGNLPQMLQPWF